MYEEKKMKGFNSFIKKFFMVVGIVTVVLLLTILLIVVVLVVVKPYGVDVTKVVPVIFDETPTSSYDHPNLTTQQEAVLESVGIDLESVPTEVSPSQKECAESALGSERVSEIESGSTPSLGEVLKAKHCFE